jgi:hypothetical protein
MAALAFEVAFAFLPFLPPVFGLLAGFGGRCGWFRRAAAVQALYRFPDPGDRRLPIRELLDWCEAGYAVPDLDQPVGRPLGCEIRQLLLAGEYFTLEICLLAAEGSDAIFCVDVECCHFFFS